MNITSQLLRQWKPLGAVPPGDLVDARLQLHHAAQLASAVGRGLIPARPDDSHANFEWLAEQQVLAGEVASNRIPLRGALRLADLMLMVMDEQRKTVREFPLNGRTVSEAFSWLERQLAEAGLDTSPLTAKPPYDIEDHPVAKGRAFHLTPPAAFQEISRYYANSDLLLRRIAEQILGASTVRCWPHHFDLAILIVLKDHEEFDKMVTVGVGLSPGDKNIPLPYFYVTPWPYPDPAGVELPELPGGGNWHTRGWVGALLPADVLVQGGAPGLQFRRLADFLSTATEYLIELQYKAL